VADAAADERPAVDDRPRGDVIPLSELEESRLVARLVFADLLRRPGGWIATLLTGVLFALLVAAVGLADARTQDRLEHRSFIVAVGGDLEGAQRTLDRLADPRLVFEPSTTVAEDVIESRAAAGIVFPPGADALLDRNEIVDLEVSYRQSQPNSVEAFSTVGVRLQELELAELAAANGIDLDLGGRADVTVTELPRDAQINRLQLARQLAPIAALLCIGVVTSVASVLGAARERRAIEPLLVLPLERRSIALGVGLGAFPLACLQVVAAVILLVSTAAIPGSAIHQSWDVLLAMYAAGIASALVLALVATGFGCLAGALGTGSDDAVSLGDLLSVAFVVAGVIAFAAPTIDATVLYASPVLGQVLLVRDLVAGHGTLLTSALAVASALVTFVVLVRWSGRLLGDQQRVLRAIR
jgi:ABC-type Na+ efflux pump permease subunit